MISQQSIALTDIALIQPTVPPDCVETVVTTLNRLAMDEPSCQPATATLADTSEQSGVSGVPSANNGNHHEGKCKICYVNDLAMVFLPCGHLVACAACALALTTCVLCRKEVVMTARVFLS